MMFLFIQDMFILKLAMARIQANIRENGVFSRQKRNMAGVAGCRDPEEMGKSYAMLCGSRLALRPELPGSHAYSEYEYAPCAYRDGYIQFTYVSKVKKALE